MVRLQNSSRLQWPSIARHHLMMRLAAGAPGLVPALATCALVLVLGHLSGAAVVTHTYTRVHNNVSIISYSLLCVVSSP